MPKLKLTKLRLHGLKFLKLQKIVLAIWNYIMYNRVKMAGGTAAGRLR